MLKINSISIAASLALAGSLMLVGCSDNATTGSSSTQAQGTSNDSVNTSTGSISGTVNVINNPTDRTILSLDGSAQIVAYNLDDNSEYTTTSTASGSYDLSGLSEGNYQVVASSTSTTMRSIKQVEVQRNTRAVVDIVLQATGIINGKLPSGSANYIVSIPGTSYISTVDKYGNFELINVPAGDVTISLTALNTMYSSYSQNLTVVGGATTDYVFSTATANKVSYVSSLGSGSTLELKHDGIRIGTYEAYTSAEFVELISLVDSAGNDVAINININNDYGHTYDEATNQAFLQSSSVLDAGTYTLKIAFATPYEKEITVVDKVAIFADSYTDAGFYDKFIGMAFSGKVTDINSSLVTVSYLDDANASQTLDITSIEALEGDDVNSSEFKINANYVNDVKYTVTLEPSLQEDGLFYVSDSSWDLDGVTIEGANVAYISIDDNAQNVRPDEGIYFSIVDVDSLDLQTMKVTLGSEELTFANGGLRNSSQSGGYYGQDYLSIAVDSSTLSYNQNVEMMITANDSYGDKTIDKTISFTTIEPKTVGMLPYTNSNDDSWVYRLYDDSSAILQAYFNVEVLGDNGSITLHDNTNNRDIELLDKKSTINRTPYTNDTNTPFSIGLNPVELLPNTEYTMSVSGFTAEDGTPLATKTNTFKTPLRRLVNNSIGNGALVDSDSMNNRVEFKTFGLLSADEKTSLVNGMTITSYNTAVTTDKTHPTPLALWEDELYGSKLVLAFTIEEGKSYELEFTGDLAKELGMSSSKLTFMTESVTSTQGTSDLADVSIVDELYFYDSMDSNLSVTAQAKGYAQVTIPYRIDADYNNDSSQACSNLYNRNFYNSTYYDAPDLNSSDVTTWMSGDDLNVTSTNVSVTGYNYNNNYDGNGNYLGSTYRCSVLYEANYIISSDINSSVSINVPDSEFIEGFNPVDTNKTIQFQIAEPGYSANVYSNSFELYFNKPVSIASLKNLLVETNPNINVDFNDPFSNYYDKNGNKYTTSISGAFDSSAYSAFKYNISGKLQYFDIYAQSTKDLNVSESGINYTQADLTPLVVTDVTTTDKVIRLDVNRRVDVDSVISYDSNNIITSSAFTLTNDDSNSSVVAKITSATIGNNNQEYLNLLVNVSDANASDCYDASSFTLTQTEFIKAENSTQKLDAGSVTETINFNGDNTGCDINTTDTNTIVD